MTAPDYHIQSLDRAASVLAAFSVEEPELSIAELARRTRLPRSTVHRIVVNLLRLGFVARSPRAEVYRLGLRLVELGAIALSQLDLRKEARPTMERLAARTGEAVFLAVLDGHWSVYLEKVEGSHSLRMTASVGHRAPLHCTATGTTLLAFQPEDEVRRLIAEGGMPKRTAGTITAIEPLLARLAEIRRRGYAIDDGESEDGLVGIAAPVFGSDNRVAAALVVAGPRQRLSPDRWAEIGPVVIAAATEISTALGHQQPLARRHP
jgi:IclR family KDG regulon transcriptional repressor